MNGLKAAMACTFLITPWGAFAEVRINEVAWAGSASDANNEWVELWNDGTASIDLAGWQLRAADGSPAIALTGTIAPAGYFLLERTDDESAPGVRADVIYTGALSNEGEKLELINASGGVVSTADGSDGWAIGGDASTKQTLQSMNGSWGTADGTPRRPNASANSAPASNTAAKKTAPTGGRPVMTGRAPEPLPTPKHREMVAIDIGADRAGTMGAALAFTAAVIDGDGSELHNGKVRWTFGDGGAGEGRSAAHTYVHPGTYVVTAHVTYEEFRRTHEDSARINVAITSPGVGIPEATPQFITLANYAEAEADLSGFTAMARGKSFTLPEGSYILPGASIRIPAAISHLAPATANEVHLYFPSGGKVALHSAPKLKPEETTVGREAPPPQKTAVAPPPALESAPIEEPQEAPAETASLAASPVFANTEEGPGTGRSGLAMMLAAVIGIGMAAMVMVRREEDETLALARQFTIVDDSKENP